MRTDKEILARVEAVKDHDWIGTEVSDLLSYLSFESVKPFLNEGVTEDQWSVIPRTRESILDEMLEYMPFAWDKANNGRGISASRSMSHYRAWTWMLGDEDKFGELLDYEFYGKDNLVAICNHYGWDSSQWDDGIREN